MGGTLAGLFTGLFGGLAGFFATWLTKKTALGVAAVATFSVLTVAILAALTALMNGLTIVTLPSWVAFGFWYFMPSYFPACVSAIIAADVATAIYKWNVENLRLLAYVT